MLQVSEWSPLFGAPKENNPSRDWLQTNSSTSSSQKATTSLSLSGGDGNKRNYGTEIEYGWDKASSSSSSPRLYQDRTSHHHHNTGSTSAIAALLSPAAGSHPPTTTQFQSYHQQQPWYSAEDMSIHPLKEDDYYNDTNHFLDYEYNDDEYNDYDTRGDGWHSFFVESQPMHRSTYYGNDNKSMKKKHLTLFLCAVAAVVLAASIGASYRKRNTSTGTNIRTGRIMMANRESSNSNNKRKRGKQHWKQSSFFVPLN